ncbi:hypothetical protein PIB30_069833 [Stylosanthes scabra]|uniref:Uncharacterized protein n=1 Tax=Stylosanthes scabra TaxID=79078 RepID=A0ABU6YKW6_9FABA|nr:hypothetical protein [Stylosanthes scabra]
MRGFLTSAIKPGPTTDRDLRLTVLGTGLRCDIYLWICFEGSLPCSFELSSASHCRCGRLLFINWGQDPHHCSIVNSKAGLYTTTYSGYGAYSKGQYGPLWRNSMTFGS